MANRIHVMYSIYGRKKVAFKFYIIIYLNF